MFNLLRSYTQLFYRDSYRIPVPKYEILLRSKCEKSIRVFQLMSYVLNETSFFSMCTKTFSSYSVDYTQVAELLTMTKPAVVSSINRDKSKLYSKFLGVEIALSQKNITTEAGVCSGLTVKEEQKLDLCIGILEDFLKDNDVSLAAPLEDIRDAQLAKVKKELQDEKISNNQCRLIINELNSSIKVLKNPDINEEEALKLVNEQLKHENEGFVSTLDILKTESIELHDKYSKLLDMSGTGTGYYRGLSLILGLKAEKKNTSAVFNEERTLRLAGELSQFASQLAPTIEILDKYPHDDLQVLSEYLVGNQLSKNENFNKELSQILTYDWKLRL